MRNTIRQRGRTIPRRRYALVLLALGCSLVLLQCYLVTKGLAPKGVGVLVYADKKYARGEWVGCLKAISCYTRLHEYSFFHEDLESIGRNPSRLNGMRLVEDASFWRKIRSLRKQLAGVDWMLVVDADMLPVTYSRGLEGFLDDRYDVVLTKRAGNQEISAASYFVRNTERTMRMLDVWVEFAYGRFGPNFNFDNGALHHVLLFLLKGLDGGVTERAYAKCDDLWTNRLTDYTSSDNVYLTCFWEAIQHRTSILTSNLNVRIHAAATGHFRHMEERGSNEIVPAKHNAHHLLLGNELFAHTKFPHLYLDTNTDFLNPESNVDDESCPQSLLERSAVAPNRLLASSAAPTAARKLLMWYGVYSNSMLAIDCWPNCDDLHLEYYPQSGFTTWLDECTICCTEDYKPCEPHSETVRFIKAIARPFMRQCWMKGERYETRFANCGVGAGKSWL